jgi:hypothetical protein
MADAPCAGLRGGSGPRRTLSVAEQRITSCSTRQRMPPEHPPPLPFLLHHLLHREGSMGLNGAVGNTFVSLPRCQPRPLRRRRRRSGAPWRSQRDVVPSGCFFGFSRRRTAGGSVSGKRRARPTQPRGQTCPRAGREGSRSPVPWAVSAALRDIHNVASTVQCHVKPHKCINGMGSWCTGTQIPVSEEERSWTRGNGLTVHFSTAAAPGRSRTHRPPW